MQHCENVCFNKIDFKHGRKVTAVLTPGVALSAVDLPAGAAEDLFDYLERRQREARRREGSDSEAEKNESRRERAEDHFCIFLELSPRQ